MNEKLRAAVYGFAVGDALGVPYEFRDRGSFKCTRMVGFGTHAQLPGTWSDDTSLVLATCDSIRERGMVDSLDIMRRFGAFMYRGEYTPYGKMFDVGMTTERAIRNRFELGNPITDCGISGDRTQGNGSLMRILPLAFVPNFDWIDVEIISKLTHKSPICVDLCCELVKYCLDLVENPDADIVSGNILRKSRNRIVSSGYVVTTLEAALWCFGTSRSYSEAVLKAVNLGGDTDTIAAITGALSALKWGYGAIPEEWIEKLANKELIDSCLF